MTQHFLHIGMPRTGTSFLQQKVFPKVEGLSFYGLETTHSSVAFNKMQYADDTLYDANEFAAAVNALQGEKVLLSNENFIGQSVYFNHINRTAIAKRLHAAMPQATVILFLRNQPDLLKSLYSIALHWKEDKTLEEFVWNGAIDHHRTKVGTGGALPSYFNTTDGHEQLDGYLYGPLIELYKGLFPNVEVLLYEDLLFNPTKVRQRLETILGVAFSEEVRQTFERKEKVHQGVGSVQAQRLRKLNRYHGLAHGSTNKQRLYNKRKRSILQQTDGSALAFPASLHTTILNFYRAHNQQLAEKYPELELSRYAHLYFPD